MGKKKINNDELVDMIDVYAFNKAELDSQKTLCDKMNKDIKEAMNALELSSVNGTDVTATITIQHRESIDEDKMITILRKDWAKTHGSMICPYLKMKYYVDMDELEKAIYHGDLDTETLVELDKCKTVTPVQALRISKKKGA